jgi:L-rhamnose mutarotase
MSLKTRALGALAGLLLSFLAFGVAGAADRPYSEGTVQNVASIRTEPGRFDDYVAWLAGPWKQLMEAQKAAGIIVDYAVYAATPRSPQDADLYLVTVYKNMAALDDLDAKSDPIAEKIEGNLAAQNKAAIERGKMRTVLGSELIREIKLK